LTCKEIRATTKGMFHAAGSALNNRIEISTFRNEH